MTFLKSSMPFQARHIFVGHSVSAMIGVLAANKRPQAFETLIMIGPFPCYINDGKYAGGFIKSDIDSLLQMLEENHSDV